MRSRLFFIIFVFSFFSAGKNEKRDNPIFQCFWETENGTIPGKTGQLASMKMATQNQTSWSGHTTLDDD